MVYVFRYLDVHNVTPLGILNFGTGRWEKLKELTLFNGHLPFIADRGCKYLSQVSLPQIENMDLGTNQLRQV
jgi:hypothetical protein